MPFIELFQSFLFPASGIYSIVEDIQLPLVGQQQNPDHFNNSYIRFKILVFPPRFIDSSSLFLNRYYPKFAKVSWFSENNLFIESAFIEFENQLYKPNQTFNFLTFVESGRYNYRYIQIEYQYEPCQIGVYFFKPKFIQ